jgi:hypothetical protein
VRYFRVYVDVTTRTKKPASHQTRKDITTRIYDCGLYWKRTKREAIAQAKKDVTGEIGRSGKKRWYTVPPYRGDC